MRLSISNFEAIPIRIVPDRPWRTIAFVALLLTITAVAGWEIHWRSFGAKPGARNSDGLWASQRRRIDNGEGDATVIVGSSRAFYDLQLDIWQRRTGRRPIQLALEGTSPLPFVEDLEKDPNFSGVLIVDTTPDVLFGAHLKRANVLNYFHTEMPSQRLSQTLSVRWVEPFLAFYDPDFSLSSVLERWPWPERAGNEWPSGVRKLNEIAADRDSHLWSKVVDDAEYRRETQAAWLQAIEHGKNRPTTAIQQTIGEQIDRMSAAVNRLRARGVAVLFVRPPSSGPYLEFEERTYPRAETWDALLSRTGMPGINFMDYPSLGSFDLPEWSHLPQRDAETFTALLIDIVQREHPALFEALRTDDSSVAHKLNAGLPVEGGACLAPDQQRVTVAGNPITQAGT